MIRASTEPPARPFDEGWHVKTARGLDIAGILGEAKQLRAAIRSGHCGERHRCPGILLATGQFMGIERHHFSLAKSLLLSALRP
jgi:hypothetical protein